MTTVAYGATNFSAYKVHTGWFIKKSFFNISEIHLFCVRKRLLNKSPCRHTSPSPETGPPSKGTGLYAWCLISRGERRSCFPSRSGWVTVLHFRKLNFSFRILRRTVFEKLKIGDFNRLWLHCVRRTPFDKKLIGIESNVHCCQSSISSSKFKVQSFELLETR